MEKIIIVILWHWRDFHYVFRWKFPGTGKISEYKSKMEMENISSNKLFNSYFVT